MTKDELYMQRCIELAMNGAGQVSPNPLVGAVIVHNEWVIGEGWHQRYGEAHAEVNAVNAVTDTSLLKESVIYVNLEPCSHQGKTPPCTDLLIRHHFKKVVIGMQDPFVKVNGTGIQKLRDAGIEVETGVLQQACEELNRRFVTFHTQQRPYVILKWAQSADGFIAPDASKMNAEEFEQKRHITGLVVQKLVHKWRTEEDAILVGTNTAASDDPALNTRAWKGRAPLRITIDRTLRLPATLHLFDHLQPTLIFTEKPVHSPGNISYAQLDFNQPLAAQVLDHLYQQGIQSLIVEGGMQTLDAFIQTGLWDEAQVFTAPKTLGGGVKAPAITGNIVHLNTIDHNQLTIYRNT